MRIWVVLGWLGGCLSYHTSAQSLKFVSFTASDGLKDSVYQLHRPIVLSANQTHLIVKFKDFADSIGAKYSYRLVGLDQHWYSNEENTSITYVNLLGGEYTMQVKNRNFPRRVATLKFRLEEAFWQKAWFVPMLMGYGGLILGVILYFIRVYKLRGQIHLQKIRNEIAADLHDDVGSTLGNISFLGEMAQMKFEKNPTDALPLINRIVEQSKEMIQTMRGMVWTINPDNDNAQDFIEKIRAFAEAMLANRGIKLYFKNEINATQTLSIEQQRHLFLVFKEIVHNIAKHAQASQVSIILKEYEHWLWAKVTDDGVGFDATDLSEGNGLRNLQQRMDQLEGKIEIQSKAKNGTIIKLMMPL